MRRDPAAFLWDICDAAQRIDSFVVGIDAARFARDVLVRSAVERQFEIIGEALNQLAKAAPDLARQIPEAARVIAFRNILIHGYATVDHRIVWRVMQGDLPQLVAVARRLLEQQGPP